MREHPAATFLARFALASLIAVSSASRAQAQPAARPLPNVLVLLSDDQRADTIGAWGNPHVRTPALDRLSQRGASFTRAYVMGAFQGAVCTPSRAMLLTSQSLWKVKEDLAGQATWPERFRASGYRTFLAGKWHNGEASLTRVFDEGRSVFVGGMSAPHDVPVRDFSPGSPATTRTLTEIDTRAFADAAIEFLRSARGGPPFLAWVAFKAPHDPRTASPEWFARFRDQPPPLPVNFLPVHPFDNGEMIVRDERLLPWPRTEADIRRELADYYASIGYLDEQVGRVLAELRALGLEENTIVVFAGDNGLAIGSHGLMGKQNLYEHSVRVPLMMAGPGIAAGLRSDALCYLQDVFPTVAGLAGVPLLPAVEGRSLQPLLADPAATVRSAVITAYRDVQRAVRDARYKLIRYPHIARTQLFDLEADPSERVDLIGRAEHADTLARMRALLEQLRREHGDTAPLEVPTPAPGTWRPPANPPEKGAAGPPPAL